MSFRIFSLVVIFFSYLLSALLYSALPSPISIHWDLNSNPDGTLPKFMGILLLPILMSLIFLFLSYLPKIDPLSKNFSSFGFDYFLFVFVLLCFLLYVHVLVLLWNLGLSFNFIQALAPAFSLLFLLLGFFISKTKRNFFIGIRTPWTLSSDDIWAKTHSFASGLFILSAPLYLLALLFPNVFILIVPPILCSLVSVGYSYLLSRKAAGQ